MHTPETTAAGPARTERLAPQARNHVAASCGRACAICQCCGRRSRPARADKDGEPDLFDMARGWSTAPFPADSVHRDGSTGSTFTCPACNKRLRKGETLQLRSYLTVSGGTMKAVS